MRIADLGFCSLGVFREITQQQAFFVSRLHPQTRLFQAGTGEPLDLMTWLGEHPGVEVEHAVELGCAARLPARLLACRVPDAVAEARGARVRERARQAGERPNPRALERVGWQLLVTNAHPERLSLHAALVVARSRWQIELLFKRWKSRGKLDEWRSAKADRVRCEVYAKLIALLIEHWLLVLGTWAKADRSLDRADDAIRSRALWLPRDLGRPRALRDTLAELVGLLSHCAALTKRRRRNSAQLVANPDLVTLA